MHKQKKSDLTSGNTSNPYYQHVVSQDFNPMKTTLGMDDTTEKSDDYQQLPLQQKKGTPTLAQQRKTAEETESTISEDENLINQQYEKMGREMQQIREYHNLDSKVPQGFP